jgi:chaperonin GroES
MAIKEATIQNVRPLSDRLLVRRAAPAGKYGRIILPDQSKKPPQKAEVLAVGPGKLRDDGTRTPMPVQKGDTVIFTKHAGFFGRLDDKEEVLIIDWNDVLAVVGEGATRDE